MTEHPSGLRRPRAETGTTLLSALQMTNRYLAVIRGRIDTLLQADLPEYVKSDLAMVCQAEQEASQIVRGMTIFCHKNL